ncbi:MAG: hypothetical protein RR621_02470 [Lachnospiraceae bacterium]
MSTLSELEPKSVFHFFEALCKIPRGTYNTKEVSDFCVNFAKERKLECVRECRTGYFPRTFRHCM